MNMNIYEQIVVKTFLVVQVKSPVGRSVMIAFLSRWTIQHKNTLYFALVSLEISVFKQTLQLKEDIIHPVHKFLLQRNLRAQFVNIVKKNTWCEALSVKFVKALRTLGFNGLIDGRSILCVRDPDRKAQACHGMYGAPLICRGRAVALMMAPDAQWINCTGHSNLLHLLSSKYLRPFMTCVSRLFEEEDIEPENWTKMKKLLVNDYVENSFDYVPELYDFMYANSDSSSGEL